MRIIRARRARAAAVLATTAVALAVGSAPASAGSDDACCSPPRPVWQDAIDLPARDAGDGVTVASIDTGVTPGRELAGRLLARVDLTADRNGLDRFGHGTHMAGLIAGDGSAPGDAPIGAAPKADLVAVKVAGWDGATDVSTVIAALRWVVSNRDRYHIRVVSLAWGTDAVQAPDRDPLDAAVERAWRAGITVVVAAGNTGPGTIAKPGDDPYVITVGAADPGGTPERTDDVVAPFSSHGTAAGAGAKPDVVAPGVSLSSMRAVGSTVDRFAPEARVGSARFKGTGTSQAAAVVAGVVARMLDANPDLEPDQVKGILMRSTGGTLAGAAGGAGLVDAGAAIDAASGKRPDISLAPANDGARPSTGAGSLDASRGSFRVATDLDGDGVAEYVAGETDVLGAAWGGLGGAWSPASWAASPWGAVVAEFTASGAVGRPGRAAPALAWGPEYWGGPSPGDAAWDAKYWGAKYWGAKYWGAKYWGAKYWGAAAWR